MEEDRPVTEIQPDDARLNTSAAEHHEQPPDAPGLADGSTNIPSAPSTPTKSGAPYAGPIEEIPAWLSDTGPTPAIKALMAANITIFLGTTIAALIDSVSSSKGSVSVQSIVEVFIAIPADILLSWGANAATVTVLDHQYWRLLTNTFLHTNLIHLGMNMYVLWDFNRLLERLYGSTKFLVIYLLAGLGSSICSLLFLDPTNVSAGASGSIFGVFGATVAFFWAFRKDFPKKFFRMYQKMFFMFLIYCVISSQMFPGMDNAAHLGGFIVGLWTALCLLPSRAGSHSWAKGNFLKLSCLTLILVVGLELDIRMSRGNPQVRGELEYQRAVKLLKHEDFREAIEQLKKAAQISPNNAAIYADEAAAYDKLKEPQEAIDASRKAITIDPKNRKALAARAAALHNIGDDHAAIADYNRIIQLDSKAAVIYNNRGWSYNALEEPDRAIADCRKALQLDPKCASAFDTLGVAYCQKGQYDLALEDFNKCVLTKPKEGAVYYHRAYAYFKLGKLDQAKADLAIAKRMDYQLDPWETKFYRDLIDLQ